MYYNNDDDFQRLLDDCVGGGAEVAIVLRHPDGTETQALIAKDARVVMETATEDPYPIWGVITRLENPRTVYQVRVTTLGQVTLYSPEFFARGGRPEIGPPGHE